MTDIHNDPHLCSRDDTLQPEAQPEAQAEAQAEAQIDACVEPDGNAIRLFLRSLSVTGDVLAAARSANYADDVAFFDLYLANVGFAAEWDAAMHAAYMRLESALVAGALQATALQASGTSPGNGDLRIMAAWHRLSINLLAAHRSVRGLPKKPGHNAGFNAKENLLSKLNLMRVHNNRNTNLVHNA